MDPLRFVLVSIAGWMNQEQRMEIEYLRAENRVLRTKIPGKRVRFTQAQRNQILKAQGIGECCYPGNAASLDSRSGRK